MNYKTLSLLILAENALFAEALMAQMQPDPGFDVKAATLSDLEKDPPALLQGLDLILFVGSSFTETEKLLRSNLYRGPILRLSNADEAGDTQDVMRLPVRLSALLQKIRALAISFWFRDDTLIEIGPLRLRPAFKDVSFRDEDPIALTEREVEILIYLYRAGGKIISRDILLAEIWGYNAEVSTHTLETHIYRLRQKIETHPEISGLLMTEPGGYRLMTKKE